MFFYFLFFLKPPIEGDQYQQRPTGTITVSIKTNNIFIITSKTITNYMMVSIIIYFFQQGIEINVLGYRMN